MMMMMVMMMMMMMMVSMVIWRRCTNVNKCGRCNLNEQTRLSC